MAPKDPRSEFDDAIAALRSVPASAGAHLAIDSAARALYDEQVTKMARELQRQAQSAQITWQKAAEEAQTARNAIMELVRGQSTPVGKAAAEQIKREGRTLNELVARKTQQLHGASADFARLSPAQRNAVYAEIVASSGKSRPSVTAAMRRLGVAGRGLIVVSVALSVYAVATADDKLDAVKREASTTGAGIAGGVAGGALAGLACGPGAPVCVAAGAFAGGVLAALGVSLMW